MSHSGQPKSLTTSVTARLFVGLCLGAFLAASAIAETRVTLTGDIPDGLESFLPAWMRTASAESADWQIDFTRVRLRPTESARWTTESCLLSGLGFLCVPVGIASLVDASSKEEGSSDRIIQGVGGAVLAVGGTFFIPWGLVTRPRQRVYTLDGTAVVSDLRSGTAGELRVPGAHGTADAAVGLLATKLVAMMRRIRKDQATPALSAAIAGSAATTASDTLCLDIEASDDVELGQLVVSNSGVFCETIELGGHARVAVSRRIPVKLGGNSIRVIVEDWSGQASREFASVVYRTKGTDSLPVVGPKPELEVTAATLDGNNTVVGGREEGVKVTVTNKGKGIAKWVRVVLEGDEYLTRQWGSERNLEDIKPGETKTATFSLLMPTELERRQAKLRVVVKEGRGYSPTTIPELTLNLVPATTKVESVEVVEDVSHGIPAAGLRRPNATALVIGVSSYSSSPLKYARQDADVFRLYASQVLGIPVANTTVLLDEQATGSRIRGRLQDWMKKKSGFKAIFFSGHGTTNPENAKDSTPYLVPHDGDRELKSTLIPADEIADLCSSDKDTLVMFLDACLSGGDKPLVSVVIPETRAITLASSQGEQPSKEFDKAQHGYFTYFTLLGLKGRADANNDGWVTTTELYNYVKEKVSDATNEVQIPVLRPEKEIRLGRVR